MTYKKKTDDDSIERRNRLHATLIRKRGLEPRYDTQWFLGFSPVIIPEVFAKVDFSLKRMARWRFYPCNSCKERKEINQILYIV